MIPVSPRIMYDNQRWPAGAVKRARLRRSHSRRGSLLAEVAITSVMLVIVMGMTVKILGWVALERRAADRRQQALVEAANLMERLAARPFDEVTPELASKCGLSEGARERLPGAELKVDVTENHPSPDRSVKRIAIRLDWRGSGGDPVAPVRLTSWIERRRKSP